MSSSTALRNTSMTSAIASTRLPVSAALATVLSALCLGGTFLTGAWFFPAVFAVVVTVGGAEVARRMSAPRSFVPLSGFVALVLYLVLVYAHTEAYLWVLPNHDALDQFRALVASGRKDIARFAAPIAVSPGIEFIVTGGVGLVALAVDTLAVTMRKAALAGLPLLALYTVPTTVAPEGVGWVAFALGGVGFLTLLLAEARERVSRWGRPMRYTAPRPNWRPEVETAPLAQVGRRVGAAALGLALVVPAVLPDLDGATFGFGGSGFGHGRGGGNVVNVINPIIDLGKDLRRGANKPVIRYTGKPTYLRLVGLDTFSGDKWEPSSYRVSNKRNDVEDGLVSPPGLGDDVATKVRSYSVEISKNLDETWLPLPYPARRVSNIEGRWVYDPGTFNVIPTNGSTRGISYRARVIDVNPTQQQLRNAGAPPESLSNYLRLPADMPILVQQTVDSVIKGAPTQFDKAVAIQNFLHDGDFVYSTEVQDTLGDANGVEAIAAFLRSREGYCVHFASTMAVMARMIGIPARVAVGFTAGRPDGNGQHVVHLHDAHAWPELYFQGVGWVPLEPTPDGSRTVTPAFTEGAGVPDPTSGAPGATPNSQPSGQPGLAGSERRARTDLPGFEEQPTGGPTGGSVAVAGRELPILPFVIVFAVLLLALVPRMARTWVRRRRWRLATSPAKLADATWDELRDTLLDYGYEWPAADPPRAGAAHLVQERGFTGEPRAALRRLASATERARYAVELGAVGDLRADVETVRAELAAQSGTLTRLRARFLPRSARSVSQAIAERFADLLDTVDGLGNRLRLRPRRGTS